MGRGHGSGRGVSAKAGGFQGDRSMRDMSAGLAKAVSAAERDIRDKSVEHGFVFDKDGNIIAGNKTHKNAELAGLDDVIIVETDGTKLVAVKRTDVDLDTKKGREMALADNATVKVDLQWDTEQLESVAEDFGIDTEEWGVIPETIINPDDFFNSLGDGEGNDKGEKIIVEIPVDMIEAKNEIRTSIEEAVRAFAGVKVK